MLRLGIIGLPNVGKSTLFNALTHAHAPAENYPFTTIEPNVGTVLIPDKRLQALSAVLNPDKIVPAHLEFVDIAGLVEGAHHGEGLGNQFLSHIRDVAATVHVVRCFASGDVAHVTDELQPNHDIDVIHTELMLADLGILQRHIPKLQKARDKESQHRAALLETLLKPLEDGQMLRTIDMPEETREAISGLGLLTHRRELYVANLGENPTTEQEQLAGQVEQRAAAEGSQCVRVFGRMEAELLDFDEEERQAFLADLGLSAPTTERLIHAGFRLLDLLTFFTTENNILQAWTLRKGQTAPQAAGQIHSDMEHGFISSDVISFDDLIRTGSLGHARQEGCLRQEGKHYEVKDGDVFRFHFA